MPPDLSPACQPLAAPLPSAQARMETWVRDHGAAVRGYVVALVRHPDRADDLVQEVFARAWQARDRYQENGTSRAYLLRIADRLVWDQSRRSRREVTLDERGWEEVEPRQTGQDPSERISGSEARQAVWKALDGLTPTQRRVLLLRYYGDLPFAEIAQQLDCPLGTVLSHCRRGLLALRRTITEDPS